MRLLKLVRKRWARQVRLEIELVEQALDFPSRDIENDGSSWLRIDVSENNERIWSFSPHLERKEILDAKS